MRGNTDDPSADAVHRFMMASIHDSSTVRGNRLDVDADNKLMSSLMGLEKMHAHDRAKLIFDINYLSKGWRADEKP